MSLLFAADLLQHVVQEGQIGDFILRNGEIAVIIEAADHAHGDGLSGGNIVDAAAAPSWSDEFDDSFTLLVAWARQAVYDAVWVEGDGSGGTAVVAASGVDSENGDIEITTRYILATDARFLTIETTITNNGPYVAEYVAGDALTVSYGDNFAPDTARKTCKTSPIPP